MKKKWEAQESLPIEELREITNEEREYEAVIEAVLFTMGNSVEVRQLAAAIGQDEETARSVVKRLMKQYEAGRKGMQIIELESSCHPEKTGADGCGAGDAVDHRL